MNKLPEGPLTVANALAYIESAPTKAIQEYRIEQLTKIIVLQTPKEELVGIDITKRRHIARLVGRFFAKEDPKENHK